jgi:hypothetical protein
MERLNEEVRRRERVIRIFPDRESAIRLLGAVLMERHEQWTTGHRYFDMGAYWQWRQAREAAPTQREFTMQTALGDAQTAYRNSLFPADPGRDRRYTPGGSNATSALPGGRGHKRHYARSERISLGGDPVADGRAI